MAKTTKAPAKTKTAAKTVNPLDKKPATNKVGKDLGTPPQKKDRPPTYAKAGLPPYPAKPTPLVVRPGKPTKPATLKRRNTSTDNKGFLHVLVSYPLSHFLTSAGVQVGIDRDVEAAVCPTDAWTLADTSYAFAGATKSGVISVLVKTKLRPPEVKTEPTPGEKLAEGTPLDAGALDRVHAVANDPANPLKKVAEATLDAVDALKRCEAEFNGGSAAQQTAAEAEPEATPKLEFTYVAVASEVRDGFDAEKFDASPWFEQAGDDEIIALARDKYTGKAATEVARFVGKNNADVLDLMEDGTVTVSEDDALEWVEANKPDLLPKLAEVHDAKTQPV